MKQRIVKVISWRIISMALTMLVMWFVTGDIKEATGLTVGLHVLLTIANFGFEVVWDEINETG